MLIISRTDTVESFFARVNAEMHRQCHTEIEVVVDMADGTRVLYSILAAEMLGNVPPAGGVH